MKRIALIGLLAATVAAPALADPVDNGIKTVSLSIRTSDLSASNEARAKLDRRVGDAVKALCGGFNADEIGDCRRSARAQFDARIAEMRNASSVELSSR